MKLLSGTRGHPRIALGLGLALHGTSAHAYVGGVIGPTGVLGLLLGVLVGIVLGIVITLRQRRTLVQQSLVLVPAMLAFAAAGGVSGLVVGSVVDGAVMAYLFRDFGKAIEHEKLPLRQAACSGDISAMHRLMAVSLDAKTKEHLPTIAWECGVANNPMPPSPAQVFDMLMPLVHRQYAQGQQRKGEIGSVEDYCDVLDHLIWRRDVDNLQRLQRLNLPLHCRDGRSRLTLKRFLPSRNGDATTSTEQGGTHEAVLTLIGGPQGPLKDAVMEFGQSFLDHSIRHGDAFFILAALEAGIDPGRPDPSDGRPAAVDWVFAKFNRCKYPRTAERLTDADVAVIDRLLRAPTAKEINAFHTKRLRGPMLSNLHEYKGCEDGGAAFFRFLKDHGADIGVAFSGHEKKFGILHHFDDIKPALLHELEQLTPAELHRLAHPSDPETGIKAEPLLDTAVRNGNAALFNFLCRRGVDACKPSNPELIAKAGALNQTLGSEPAGDSSPEAAAKLQREAEWRRYLESQECLDVCLPPIMKSREAACPHCPVVPKPRHAQGG